MDLQPKKPGASARDQARTLYLQDDYTDESIAAAVGVSVRQLRKWADAGGWDDELVEIQREVTRRARFVEANRRLRVMEVGDDKSAKIIEATIGRFLRDRLSSSEKVTAADVRALVAAVEQLRQLHQSRRSR